MIKAVVDDYDEYVICAAIHYDNGVKYRYQGIYGVDTGFVIGSFRHPMAADILPTNPYFMASVFAGTDDEDRYYADKVSSLDVDWCREHPDELFRYNTVQGFITSKGRFVDRKEAYEIAVKCGQIKDDRKTRELFSEDLYPETIYNNKGEKIK